MCVFLVPKHPYSSSQSLLQSLGAGGAGGEEKPSKFQASTNELKSISEPFCSIAKQNTPGSFSLLLSLSVTHIYLGKVSYDFQFMGIIKLQIVLGGHVGSDS